MPPNTESKVRRRAAWRAWYRRNKTAAKAYYHDRYVERRKNETPEEKEKRQAKARVHQKNYADRKKNLKE